MATTTSSVPVRLSIDACAVSQDEIEALGKGQKIGAGLERKNV
jgi:hypothetical protein